MDETKGNPPRLLAEAKLYHGRLSLGQDSLVLSFRAGIDARGEIDFSFDSMPLTDQVAFILLGWQRDGARITYFDLDGTAEDGTRIETKHLNFESVNTTSDANGSRMELRAQCSMATLVYKLPDLTKNPVLRMRLKGFRAFRVQHVECPFGKVVVAGNTTVDDADTITGYIAIEAGADQKDAETWRSQADRLAEHIRRVLSFASSAMLRAPIVEFFHEDTVTVQAWSQSMSAMSAMPVIHPLNLSSICTAAVQSYFDAPIKVRNLFFTLEWFAMDASYTEVRLVAAMTALENLIHSNGEEADEFITPPRAFEKTRRMLRGVLRACIAKWPGGGVDALSELNEKLADLNRRSLLRKLKRLAGRWSVPLDGIADEGLHAAKQARDRIVHRGQYYEGAPDGEQSLWVHALLIREVAVRFVLTAIGFKGRYLSYVGGCHDAEFPPPPTSEK